MFGVKFVEDFTLVLTCTVVSVCTVEVENLFADDCRPDMTSAVDWALKANYLSICLLIIRKKNWTQVVCMALMTQLGL